MTLELRRATRKSRRDDFDTYGSGPRWRPAGWPGRSSARSCGSSDLARVRKPSRTVGSFFLLGIVSITGIVCAIAALRSVRDIRWVARHIEAKASRIEDRPISRD